MEKRDCSSDTSDESIEALSDTTKTRKKRRNSDSIFTITRELAQNDPALALDLKEFLHITKLLPIPQYMNTALFKKCMQVVDVEGKALDSAIVSFSQFTRYGCKS